MKFTRKEKKVLRQIENVSEGNIKDYTNASYIKLVNSLLKVRRK